MKRKTTFGTIAVLSFVVSALFTISLFCSTSVGKFAIMLMFMSALIFEMSKWCLLWEGFSQKHGGLLRGILICLWLSVTLGSIVASCGYVLRQSNQSQNIATVSSIQYKNAEQSRQILIDSYNQKSAEVQQLKKQAEELPKNYYTAKSQIMQKVSEKAASISGLAQKIQEPVTAVGILNENGYSAFFDMFAKMIGEDAKMIELVFFMSLGIILELIGNLFSYLYQKESGSSSTPNRKYFQKSNNSEPKIGFKPEIISAKKEDPIRPIGFKIDQTENPRPFVSQNVQGFDNVVLNRYLDYIYSNKKSDGSIPGYQVTAKDMQLGIETIRKLKAHCEQLKIIESNPLEKRTKLLKLRENIIL